MAAWEVFFLLGAIALFFGFSGMLAYGSWVTGRPASAELQKPAQIRAHRVPAGKPTVS